jgi:hypothetical protein
MTLPSLYRNASAGELMKCLGAQVERAIARRKGQILPADPVPPPGLDPGFRSASAEGLAVVLER